MDRQMRIAVLVDHYKHPRHRGPLADADVHMPGGNPGCGDLVTLHVRAASEDERVEAVRFEGEGCTISQAAASILADRINKRTPTFSEIEAMTYEEMIALLGEDVVGSRPRCATLALGTLKAAVRRIAMDRRLRAAGRTDEEIAAMRAALARQASGEGLVFGEEVGASPAAAGGGANETTRDQDARGGGASERSASTIPPDRRAGGAETPGTGGSDAGAGRARPRSTQEEDPER